nr:Protein SMA-9, isoform m [Haemonchus contortus]
MVWYGTVWYGMVWYGMVWYGMVWYGYSRVSPGIRSHRLQSSARNRNSYGDPLMNAKSALGDSLASGVPMCRNMKQEFVPTCSFCLLTFPNEAGLQVHEIRCSRKVEATHAETERVKFDATITIHNATKNSENDAYSRHPLKRRLLAAVAFEQHSPTKILRPESSEIVVTNERKTPTADVKEAGAKIDVKSDAPCSTRRYTAGRVVVVHCVK